MFPPNACQLFIAIFIDIFHQNFLPTHDEKSTIKVYYLFLLNGFSFELYWFYLRTVCLGSQPLEWRIVPSVSMDSIFVNIQLICRHQIFCFHGIRSHLKKGEDGDKTRRIIDCKSVDNSIQFSRFPSIYLRHPKYRTVTAVLCVRTAFKSFMSFIFF